ncbi:MAG TPA: M28 family metallopeptidase [Sphingomonadaceae bacterium]|nr:M28 family metallopeptidase [Sphingomonadaceae bacterium]
MVRNPFLRHVLCIAPVSAAALLAGASIQAKAGPADAWWSIVAHLADDSLEGRMTGSAGYAAAAALVESEFRNIGLEPAGTEGFYQPVDFFEQTFDMARSSASLVGPGEAIALSIPQDIYFRGAHAMPGAIDAPMVFAGYGLSIPEAGHDDFAGIDVRGKIVLVIAGGPADISGSVKANARSERARMLARRGALGLITLTSPRQMEIPWERQILFAGRPSMYLADEELREVNRDFVAATFAPERAHLLFEGAAHSFAEVAALADVSGAVPVMDLPLRFSARIVASTRPVRSANLIARLPGSDAKLAGEHIVLSAHLDGLGILEPVDGDAIYNGAFDNAVGVANVISIARELTKEGERPRRSILFFVPTAEEMGLLGSRYFVQRPTVPIGSIVANINFDMPLPIFPLRSVTPIGFEESTLGDEAAAVSAELNLPIVPDPFPDRNVFIRSDQYSFVRAGIPALFPKYGFAAGTPEAALERAWRAQIYHSPRDDANQPVLREEAVKLNAWTLQLLRRVANAPARPKWRATSYFARYAP